MKSYQGLITRVFANTAACCFACRFLSGSRLLFDVGYVRSDAEAIWTDIFTKVYVQYVYVVLRPSQILDSSARFLFLFC